MKFINSFLEESKYVIENIDTKQLVKIIHIIKNIQKNKGRIFFLGVGGSAANCSHAVNDFRKILGIECYTPVDNVSELTARTNDEGWETVFEKWLQTSNLCKKDLIFIFSVGGGNSRKKISMNIVKALVYAKKMKSKICGIVGNLGGYTTKVADACIKINVKNKENITPQSEAFQAVIWHLIVSHPELKKFKTKW
jgi:D-sedoheptulose 7-phosphate isomerase